MNRSEAWKIVRNGIVNNAITTCRSYSCDRNQTFQTKHWEKDVFICQSHIVCAINRAIRKIASRAWVDASATGGSILLHGFMFTNSKLENEGQVRSIIENTCGKMDMEQKDGSMKVDYNDLFAGTKPMSNEATLKFECIIDKVTELILLQGDIGKEYFSALNISNGKLMNVFALGTIVLILYKYTSLFDKFK